VRPLLSEEDLQFIQKVSAHFLEVVGREGWYLLEAAAS